MSDDTSLVRAEHWGLLMHDLNASRPAYVLDASGANLFRWRVSPDRFPVFSVWLTREYRQIDVVDGVRIFRRRACVAG